MSLAFDPLGISPKVSDLRNQGRTNRLIFFSPAAEATEGQLGKRGYPISEVKERRDSSIYLARRRTRGTVFTQLRCATCASPWATRSGPQRIFSRYGVMAPAGPPASTQPGFATRRGGWIWLWARTASQPA
jgi:hypothetical protein